MNKFVKPSDITCDVTCEVPGTSRVKKRLKMTTESQEYENLIADHTKKVLNYVQSKGLTLGPAKPLITDSGDAVNTNLADIKTIKGLAHFFAMIGDLESSIMLIDTPPEKCPSMSANSLMLFLKFKCGTLKEKILKDFNGIIQINFRSTCS